MKKLILLFIASCGALQGMAQDTTAHKHKKPYTHDRDLSRWVIDVNFIGGAYMQNFTTSSSIAGYNNEITALSNNGTLKFTNGSSFGGDAQIGYFFGKKKHWGIGTGFLYMYQMGDANLNNFHVEYEATNSVYGNVYRQIVTGDNVQEHITSNNMNIPLLLKYKNRFSKHWGFTGDIGALFNVQMNNKYNNNKSAFDYEAIADYSQEAGGYVYDQGATPAANDQIMTKAFFEAHNNVSLQQSVANAQAQGYNVAFGVKPTASTGSESYTTGSVGFMVQPGVNYFFSDRVALSLGVYYIYQPFKNNAQSDYMLTNAAGSYTSVLHNVTASDAQTFGGNVGLRFFLGGSEKEHHIAGIDSLAPTLCGNCDGVITLHGFKKNKKAELVYDYNGVTQPVWKGRVDADGNIVMKNLCAGSYTNILVKTRHKGYVGYPVSIVAPQLVITSENSTNPTANGACDGTIILNGLYAGKQATVTYTLNGAQQQPYTGVVRSDNTILLTNLCEGTYSNVVVTISTCTANGTDVTLTAPPPPPPPAPPVDTTPQRPDISTPILFNFNKATVHKSSLPLIKEAAEEMKADPDAVLKIDGYTDAIGSQAYNKKLSNRRAAAVKNHLRKYGVSGKRIKTVGHGKKDPVATNKTPEGRAENRRAVMDLEDKK